MPNNNLSRCLDSPQYLIIHQELIRHKGLLNHIYNDFYSNISNLASKKPIVELGSGGGFIKEIIPQTITSDIVKGPGIDKVFYVEKMPFRKNSVGTFVMFDVLHHIKNPEIAIREMQRCLKKEGKIIMIEPYCSFWGGLIYKYLHHERFDPTANWQIKGTGRMSNANTALPWIIFVRDRNMFEEKFPNLKILKLSPHTPLAYLISGGLTKYQFLPNFTYPLIKFLEYIISPLNSFLGMFATIEIQKK